MAFSGKTLKKVGLKVGLCVFIFLAGVYLPLPEDGMRGISVAEASGTQPISSLDIGDEVVDHSWQLEHGIGNNYTYVDSDLTNPEGGTHTYKFGKEVTFACSESPVYEFINRTEDGNEGLLAVAFDKADNPGPEQPAPRFGVVPQEGFVYGFHWEPEAEVTIAAGGDEIKTESDRNGAFTISRGALSVDPGDTVTVEDGVTTKTHLVTELELDEVDRSQNIASGTAEAGTDVTVGIYCWYELIIHEDLKADDNGEWEFDFYKEYEYEFHDGTEVFAWQLDDDDDRTYNIDFPGPYFNVYPGDGIIFIFGRYWSFEENMSVTVNDQNDNEVRSFEVESDVWGEIATWDEVVDFKPGYTVKVNDITAGIEKTHLVTSLKITEYNRAENTVSGTGSDNFTAEVRAWDFEDNFAYLEVEVTDGSWEADFSGEGVNIGSGTYIEAWQADEDRDTTADDKYIPYPIFTVDPSSDTIAVHNWPANTELDVTVEDPAGPSWSGSIVTDENGDYWLSIINEFDIDTGHTVTVTDGITTKVHEVTALRIDQVDWENNIISGVAEPGTDVEVEIYDNPYPVRIETADGNGNWTADFSTAVGDEPRDRAYDISIGSTGNANQRDDEGDETHIYWEVITFHDVPVEHDFFNYIEAIVEEGIADGIGDNMYGPGETLNRGQMARFLFRAYDLELEALPTTPTFTDVSTGHVFYKDIEAIVAEGITKGVDEHNYDPSTSVTRGQMAAFLVRADDSLQKLTPAEPTFSDVPVSHNFYGYIEAIVVEGITKGVDEHNYDPSAPINRGQMAAFLSRALNLHE